MKKFGYGMVLFDGADGAGKSVQLQRLADYLQKSLNLTVKKTRALGGTGDDWIQNQLRTLLLSPQFPANETADEEAIFSLSDLRNMRQMKQWLEVNPEGVVLGDRGFISHIVYFMAKGHAPEEITAIHGKLLEQYRQIGRDHRILNLVFIPEDEQMSLDRIKSRGLPTTPRLENLDFQKKVIGLLRNGDRLLQDYPDVQFWNGIDTIFIEVKRNESIDQVHERVLEIVDIESDAALDDFYTANHAMERLSEEE